MTVEEKLERALRALFGSSLGDLFWYGLLAGGVWLFFFVAFRTALRHRRVSRRDPTRRQVAREVLHSLRSIAVFGLVTGAVVFAAFSGWTRLYVRVDEYGWVWFFLSIAVMVVVHDAYFYWTHRLMHHPRLYRVMHHTHHRSTSPTPWAAYAFSPAEALVQAGIGPLIVFTIPVHPAAFALFMVWQIAFNVFGHCGYEIFPRCFLHSRAGLLLNSVTHHALHHEKFRANFGLYFNVWDRLMGTNHAEYEERFEQATGPKKGSGLFSGQVYPATPVNPDADYQTAAPSSHNRAPTPA
jgi:lathosterol oxidase